MENVVTRFAPSPTGFMHVGNVRTAIFAWLWARKNNGTFILRIEDTDKRREVEGSIDHIKRTLKWLGIDWDQGPDVGGPFAPYIQSERMKQLGVYKKYADRLIKGGFAYADATTEEELNTYRKQAEESKKAFLFRERRPTNPPEWKPGIPLRFKVVDLKRTTWHDAVRGELTAGQEVLDDFILIKSDGFPTYNFAHLVDDIEMGVTHIIRGQEFISSMPNYIAVYEALNIKQPVYITAPPIMGEGGNKKMGKREGAKDTLDYMREGYLPEALFNFLAFLGWNPGGEQEIMSQEEIVTAFDIHKLQKAGAQFNDEKLAWMNKEHIRRLSTEDLKAKVKEFTEKTQLSKISDSVFDKLLPVMIEHVDTFGELREQVGNGEFDYVIHEPQITRDLIKTTDFIPGLISIVEKIEENVFIAENIKSAIWDFATEKGRGNVLWPMRYSLTGKEKSPDPFKVAFIIGKEETLKRLRNALSL